MIFSSNFIAKVNRLVFTFLWKNEWVSRRTLVLPPVEGGLGIFHVESRLAAFRCDHLRRLMIGSSAKWQIFARYWIGLSLRKWAPALASNLFAHSEWRPEFYSKALFELRQICLKQNSPSPFLLTVKVAYRNLLPSVGLTPRCIMKEPLIEFVCTCSVQFGNLMFARSYSRGPSRARLVTYIRSAKVKCL